VAIIRDPINCHNPIIFHAKDSEVPEIKQIHFRQRHQKLSLHDDSSMSPKRMNICLRQIDSRSPRARQLLSLKIGDLMFLRVSKSTFKDRSGRSVVRRRMAFEPLSNIRCRTSK
jgi:hypothetical protein